MAERDGQTGGGVSEKTRTRTTKPPLFRVILHNDDYTTMEFVLDVLETIFLKSPAEAHRIMMLVHTSGAGTCGAYPHEVAETKVGQVQDSAREHGFPLRASMEEE